MIAALFVATGGCYFGLPDVDPWDEARDARLYTGPWPAVAHPPCARWGRMAESAFGKTYGVRGDDFGCFASALESVRQLGGVLEHPEYSSAWTIFAMERPRRGGGWIKADRCGGWTCSVEQGNYGHRTRKTTWLYANGTDLPALRWERGGPVGDTYCDLSRRQRAATPPEFRDLLLSIARSAQR